MSTARVLDAQNRWWSEHGSRGSGGPHSSCVLGKSRVSQDRNWSIQGDKDGMLGKLLYQPVYQEYFAVLKQLIRFHSVHLNINHQVGMLGSEVFATTESKCKVSEIADLRDSPRWMLFSKCQKNAAKKMESSYLYGCI